MLCRYPDVFGAAIGMSGTYRIEQFLDGGSTEDLYFSSPMDFLPGLDGRAAGPAATAVRRSSLPARAPGRTSARPGTPANILGSKGMPNRVDVWGGEWAHEWPTWGRMLPQYLDELC